MRWRLHDVQFDHDLVDVGAESLHLGESLLRPSDIPRVPPPPLPLLQLPHNLVDQVPVAPPPREHRHVLRQSGSHPDTAEAVSLVHGAELAVGSTGRAVAADERVVEHCLLGVCARACVWVLLESCNRRR